MPFATRKAERLTRMSLIAQSFELAAQRCEDLTPLVYHRLFQERPEAKAMFRSGGSDLVRRSMLALTVESLLDFAGERSGKFRMIACELQSHDAYGTPPELFGQFFGIIAVTLKEILGADWSADMESAWRHLLLELDRFVVHSN